MTPLSWLGEKVGQEELEDSQRLPKLCNEQQIGQKGCDDVDPAEGLGTLGVPVLHLIINPRGIWATGRVYLVLVFPALTNASIPVAPRDAAGTGEEDERQENNKKDTSTLEEMWIDILYTVEDANGAGSDDDC
ncbi:hypothetical protein V1506DRAFT_509635 [Lipomyces tetrasporus]